MSIQQSFNQAISGSLFLLNQTDFFQRRKAIRDAKREAKTRKEIREKVDNDVVAEKNNNTGSDASQQATSEQATTAQVDEATANAAIELLKEMNDEDSRKKEANMLMDMQSKLRGSVAEAEQAKKSEEFRKMILRGVYVKGDRWDGK